ncbi:hypothetical protein N7474_000320 [Penicillium riverlandense]|uniref:uncharacterized protein n=1 Tax=Penicillium riverlandense TaxID=1903569 RepID=UPI002547CE91|nr:uncharacterized protein N7474_000320 [Penicillium riverlandense]KAJ5832009.1 hypothetical protein N7474_000320 [Penicillium riverlandense]
MSRSQGNSTDQMGDVDRELAETEARNLMPPPPVPPLPTHPPLPIPPWRTVSPPVRLPGPDELASPFANPVWYPEPPLPAWHSDQVPTTTHRGLPRHPSSSPPEPRSPRTYGDFIPAFQVGASPPELPLEPLPQTGATAPNTSSRNPAVLARNELTTFFGVEPAGPPDPREPSTSVMLDSLTPIDPQLMPAIPTMGDMSYSPSSAPNSSTTVPGSRARPTIGPGIQFRGGTMGGMPYTPSNVHSQYTTASTSYAAPINGPATQLQGVLIGDMPYTPSSLPNPYTMVPASYTAPMTVPRPQHQGVLTEATTPQMPAQHVQNSPRYLTAPRRPPPSLNTTQGMHPMPVEREYALQSWLVRQQLLAGIPIDQLEPMQGPRSRQQQVSPSGIHTRYRTPALLMITEDGIRIPRLPLAQFQGTLQPLPNLPGPPAIRSQQTPLCHRPCILEMGT